jgi:uncharacterized protein
MGTHYLVHESLSERQHRPGMSPDINAAKRGAEAAEVKYDREYYHTIGKKGGAAVRERRSHEYYTHIGRMGGAQTKARYGTEHFARIGKRGAQARGRAKEQGRG